MRWEQIDTDILKYGKQGDGTLEYIGINMKQGKCVEYKCYRFMLTNGSDSKIYTNLFGDNCILKPLDFEQDYDKELYRIAYKLNSRSRNGEEFNLDNLEECIDSTIMNGMFFSMKDIIEINNFIKNVLGTELEPLSVIGARVDKKQRKVCQLKLYYQLKIFNKSSNISYVANEEKYIKVINFLCSYIPIKTEEIAKVKNLYVQCSNNFFEPMMIGIDFDDKRIKKVKYYFQNQKNESIDTIIRIFQYEKDYFCYIKEIIKLIQEFAKRGLKLKGFAISYTYVDEKFSTINFYFCE
jgi:hypothetical protein